MISSLQYYSTVRQSLYAVNIVRRQGAGRHDVGHFATPVRGLAKRDPRAADPRFRYPATIATPRPAQQGRSALEQLLRLAHGPGPCSKTPARTLPRD